MGTEPALIIGALTAIIDLAVAFGAPIDPGQKATILAAVSAGIAVVGAFVVRANVTPTAQLNRSTRGSH